MSTKLTLDGAVHEITIVRRRPHLVLVIDGRQIEVTGAPARGDGRRSMSINGREVSFTRAASGDRQIVRLGGRTFEVGQVDRFSGGGAAGGGQNTLRAPMPGAVVSVHHQPGTRVKRGEPLVTIESMKLQTALPAPRDGVVAAILRAEGETFEKDEVIATLEPENEDA